MSLINYLWSNIENENRQKLQKGDDNIVAHAKDNEEKLKERLGKNLKDMLSFGQKTEDTAYISVDFHYKDKDGKLFLIEVDSSNEAKINVGEYCLINALFGQPNKESETDKIVSGVEKSDCTFVVVLFNKNNTIDRNNKALEVVKKAYTIEINYMTILADEITDWESFEKAIHNSPSDK